MAWVRLHCSGLVLKTLDNVPRILVQSSETDQFAGSGGARQSCATSGGHRNAISKSAGRSGQSCLDERWQRDFPAATHSTTSANCCANCVCLRTPSWANPSDAPSRCRLVESWRAAPLVLPWAPSTTHLRDPESRVPGLGSPPSPILWICKSHDFGSESALDGCRLHSLAEAALTGICVTRSGHAPKRDPRCGRLRPPDLQSRDLRFAPFMSNTHVRSSNEDLWSTGRPCQSLGLGSTKESSV